MRSDGAGVEARLDPRLSAEGGTAPAPPPAPRVTTGRRLFFVLPLVSAGLSLACGLSLPSIAARYGRGGAAAAGFLALALLGGGTGLLLRRRAGRSERATSHLFSRISGERIRLDLRLAPGEAGELAEAVNRVLEGLNEDVLWVSASTKKFNLFAADIGFSSRQLSERSRSLRDAVVGAADQVARLAREFGSTGLEVADLADRLEAEARSTVELSAAAERSLGAFARLEQDVAKAGEDARAGAEGVELAIRAAGQLRDRLAELEKATAQSAEGARRMGQALAVVEDIVERTSILSVNASIEAARAGQLGRGFAVVAGEVRKLAESSRGSLGQVGEDLAAASRGMGQAAAFAASSRGEAERFTALMEALGGGFAGIRKGVEEISSRLAAFSAAFSLHLESSSGMVAGTRSATEAIRRIHALIEAHAAVSAALDSAAQTASERSTHAHEAAETLAQLGSYLKVSGMELSRIVGRFVLDPNEQARKYPRRSKREILLYNLEVYDEEGELLGYVGDISLHGMLLYAERDFHPGEKFLIRIAPPREGLGNLDRIRLNAEVIRAGLEDGVRIAGLAYEDPVQAAESGLGELISRLAIDLRGSGGMAELEAVD